MSYKSVGDPFGVSSYNNLLKQGLGDNSTPGTGEVRLFEESGKYILRVWNGTEWINVNKDIDSVPQFAALQLVGSSVASALLKIEGFASAWAGMEINARNSGARAFITLNNKADTKKCWMEYSPVTEEWGLVHISGTPGFSVNKDYQVYVEGGVIGLKETITPTAAAGVGKIYSKDDNRLYFQTGAGTEDEIPTGLFHVLDGSVFPNPEIYVFRLGPGPQSVSYPYALTGFDPSDSSDHAYVTVGRHSSSGTDPIYLYNFTTTGFSKNGSAGCEVIVIGRRDR